MPATPASSDFTTFVASLSQPQAFAELFDYLPHVQLFTKDARGRFVHVNKASLAMHGCRKLAEMVGKTDFDFHPPALAAQYVEEDQRVMQSRRPLADQVWLVQSHDGMPQWYLCTKIPLFGPRGKVVGLAGVMRLYDHAGPSPRDYHRLTPVMEFVLANFRDKIEVEQLAAAAHLSVSQLQREFRRLFAMSPGDYVLKVRLLAARRRLEETTDPVGTVALDCGFYDQSHFTRAFTAEAGLPPMAYRRRFLEKAASGVRV